MTMNLNIKRKGKIIRTIRLPSWTRLPVVLLMLLFIPFFFFMLLYGLQWCGLWLLNAMFHTHVPMSLFVWFVFTVFYLLTGIIKFQGTTS